jgi:DNA-binding CsgD family transcriptional regulator
MGLDNGIAYFEYQNAIRHINPPSFKNGVGYDVLSFDNQLYFALSTGLQCLPITQKEDLGNIADVPKLLLSGLTWKVAAIKGQIVTGRDDGFWHIKNQKANPVSRKSGYWNFKPMPTSDSLQIVAGSYLGVRLLKLENGEFKDQGKIPGFSESSRYLETDNGHIWVSHPYRGVYKIYASDGSLVLFRQKDGLPSDLDNHVFKIKEKILLATSRGIYEFDSVQNRMVKSSFFEPIFGELPIRYLKEDNKGNIWFVQEKMVGVIDFSSGKPRMHYLPELKNKIASGFENIFPYDSKNIFVGSDEGFFHINYEKYQTKIKPFSVYLTQVKTISAEDSTLYGGFQFQEVAKSQNPAYPYGFNSLHFAFAASVFDHSSSLEFSHFLEGFDKTWSSWTPKSEKDYTNLPEGTYHFHMKARKSPSHESSVFTYSFTIDPPIYRTFAAYILYIISVAGFLFALLKFQSRRYRKRQEARRQADQKKFREEQEQMAYRHQLEMEKSEKEFIRLQNDKLESEIEHKNTELASATMNLVQKKEFILKLKTELQHYQEINKVGGENPELKKLLKTLSEEEKLNKEWEHFSQHFNSMYGDFLTVLKSKFPTLKPHELQLCAYLRMNLSSKEIAPLMSISVRGVEIGRYRLRKKLNLSTEENLVQYLLDLKMN